MKTLPVIVLGALKKYPNVIQYLILAIREPFRRIGLASQTTLELTGVEQILHGH
jgi:hypothetical protein